MLQSPWVLPSVNGKVRSKVKKTSCQPPTTYCLCTSCSTEANWAAQSLKCLLQRLYYKLYNGHRGELELRVCYLKILDQKPCSKLPHPSWWLQICMQFINTESTALTSLFLPPTNSTTTTLFFFLPPYLITFVYSVSYLSQGLSLHMCLFSALHKGWQL